MPIKNTTRHNIWLNKDDLTRLHEIYPDISVSIVIRTLIQRHLRGLQRKPPTEVAKPSSAVDIFAGEGFAAGLKEFISRKNKEEEDIISLRNSIKGLIDL